MAGQSVPLNSNLFMKITVTCVQRGARPNLKRIKGSCPVDGDFVQQYKF